MIQEKENDLQSMDWYKEKEEDMQSMWLNFLNDSESIIFQMYVSMFPCLSILHSILLCFLI